MGRAKRERTKQLFELIRRRRTYEQVQNVIEQKRFDNLVRNGVIVPERPQGYE